jgi:DNA-binding NarL/FixJ family response regulator
VRGSAPIRVVVGEDQPIFLNGIVQVLEEGGFEVAGTARDAPDLLRKIGAHHPDVAVADIEMPPDRTDDGLRALLQARASQPGLGALVLSKYLEDRYALDLVAAGAEGVGYLLKEKVGDVTTFTDAVRGVANGATALDPDVVALLLGRRRRSGPLDDLTKRQRQVLALIAEGKSNPGIAEELVVSVGAVEHHVTNIFEKLDLPKGRREDRRVLAVLEYLKQ